MGKVNTLKLYLELILLFNFCVYDLIGLESFFNINDQMSKQHIHFV